MDAYGELEVHGNVVFEANTAYEGGAVSLTFEIGSHLPVGFLQDTFGTGKFNSVLRRPSPALRFI